MKNSDFVELTVEQDGDINLTKRPEETLNLCYKPENFEKLEIELLSYGCDKKSIRTAILKSAFSKYYEVVTV